MRFLNLKNHSILVKLSILIIISIIPLLLMLTLVVLPEVENQWYENKYEATKTTVEAVFNTLDHYSKKVDGVNYSLEDAKADAAALVKSQRYEGKNYFWINDTEHRIVAHPLRPEREGQDASNLKDADGKRVYVEFVNACKNPEGEGFVRYNQLKPGIEEPQPKLSFVKLYKPWGWIIGSGVYLNDVAENVNELKSSVYQTIGLAVVIAFLIGFFIARFISVPIQKLSDAAEKVSNGDLSARVDLDGDNELGKLGRNFNKMTQNINENISTIEKKEVEANRKALEAEEAKKISEIQKTQLSESVKIMLVEMDKFSNGDLTVTLPVKSEDEIGKLFRGFNTAVRKINDMITKVTELSSETMSSVNIINTRTEEIATGSHEQSSQITDVASAVEEMTANIHSTTDHSSIATERAKSAGKIAKKGGEVVASTVKGMVSISKIVDSAAIKINTLGENSKQIGEIIQVINEIADQTNLLALNAAIEAARAGEQGRGFAVVADEVRKLAERTTTATKEISEMIKKIQDDTLDAVNSINSGTKEVESGKNLAYQAGQSLEQIIKGSEDVVDVIAQVAMATEEQGSAAAIISQNLVGISTATEETTHNIHEIAHSVERLNSLTHSLDSLINEFKVNNGGSEVKNTKARKLAANFS